MTITRVQKQALLGVGIIGILLVAYIAYQQLTFRLVSATPKKTSSTTAAVVFTFNKELISPQDIKFSIEPTVPGIVSVSGKTVIFTPRDSYRIGKQYNVFINSVTSKGGDKVHNLRVSFTPKFVEEKDLSADDKERALSMTDRLEKENSILTKLPYSTVEFKVDYDIIKNAKDEEKVVLRVTLYPILNRPDQYSQYVAQLTDYKTKAVAWIEQNAGGKFYTVLFSPEIPEQQQAADDYTGDGAPPEAR